MRTHITKSLEPLSKEIDLLSLLPEGVMGTHVRRPTLEAMRVKWRN